MCDAYAINELKQEQTDEVKLLEENNTKLKDKRLFFLIVFKMLYLDNKGTKYL